MTLLSCPDCRLRFSAAASAYVTTCPECGEPPQPTDLGSSLGFRLVGAAELRSELPEALAVSIPVPDPGAGAPADGR